MGTSGSGARLRPVFAEVAEVAGYLWDRGWAERNAGNISVDVSEAMGRSPLSRSKFPVVTTTMRYPGLEGRSFLVTVSGSRMRDVARAPKEHTCIIRVTDHADGYHIVWGEAAVTGARPTSELPTHLVIHERLRSHQDPHR